MSRIIRGVFIALVAVVATMSVAPAARAVGSGHEGCTPDCPLN